MFPHVQSFRKFHSKLFSGNVNKIVHAMKHMNERTVTSQQHEKSSEKIKFHWIFDKKMSQKVTDCWFFIQLDQCNGQFRFLGWEWYFYYIQREENSFRNLSKIQSFYQDGKNSLRFSWKLVGVLFWGENWFFPKKPENQKTVKIWKIIPRTFSN